MSKQEQAFDKTTMDIRIEAYRKGVELAASGVKYLPISGPYSVFDSLHYAWRLGFQSYPENIYPQGSTK